MKEEQKNAVRAIEGWCNDEEMQLLYWASKLSSGNVLEIGSWKGRSTLALIFGMEDSKNTHRKIIACDSFTGSPEHGTHVDTYPDFKSTVTDKENQLIVFRAKSTECTELIKEYKYSVIFIDGNHSHQSVTFDYQLAKHCIEPNGLIIFHDAAMHELAPQDTPWPEVALFVDSLLTSGEVTFVSRDDRCITVRVCTDRLIKDTIH